jgi:DNA primase
MPRNQREQRRNYLDWNTFKEQIDIVEVADHLYPDSDIDTTVYRRSLFCWCPFHDDQNKKSLALFREIGRFECYACHEHGDAATLVMRQKDISFPDAVRFLHENFLGDARTDFSPESSAPESSSDEPTVSTPSRRRSVFTKEEALKIVAESQKQFHSSPPNSLERWCLMEYRHLSLETIEKHQLGWVGCLEIPTEDGKSYQVSGIVIPYFDDHGELVQAQIRKVPPSPPKYVEVFTTEKFQCYPNPAHIMIGKPLIVVEGEFDCLLLQQILGDLVSVITFGSVTRIRQPWKLREMLLAPVWSVALDNDKAGKKAAAKWPPRAIRVKPPGYKDWAECRHNHVDLLSGWVDILSGREPDVWKFCLRYAATGGLKFTEDDDDT